MTSKAISKIPRKLALSNEAYDFWNNFVTLVLPGVGALYSAIAILWHLGYGEQVVGTIAAIVVFGKILLIVSKSFYKSSGAAEVQAIESLGTMGTLVVDTADPNKEVVTLDMGNTPVLSLADKKVAIFKVDDQSTPMDPRLIDNSH